MQRLKRVYRRELELEGASQQRLEADEARFGRLAALARVLGGCDHRSALLLGTARQEQVGKGSGGLYRRPGVADPHLLNEAGVHVKRFAAKDPATKALFEFVDQALKK